MKGSAAIILLIVGILVVLGMLAYIFVLRPQLSNTDSSAGTSTATVSIPVKDFAPGTPMSQKTTILIMSNDSSEEKYIVPTNEVDTYVKQLPPGYHVVSKTQ